VHPRTCWPFEIGGDSLRISSSSTIHAYIPNWLATFSPRSRESSVRALILTRMRSFCIHLDISRTEPSAFLLDVFFNAHPISPDAKSKQRAANVLVPTTIAYTGGQVDFSVNIASDVCFPRIQVVRKSHRVLVVCDQTHYPQRKF
jgi:hypothetical protein